MSTPDDTDPLARRARAEFDAACAHLDAADANRLRLARRTALAGPPRARSLAWAPIAGAVAVGLLAVWAWPRSPGPAPAATPIVDAPAPTAAPAVPVAPEPPVVALEDPDPLAGDDLLTDAEPEWEALGDEDAELYAWLADAPVAPDAGADAL